MTAVRIELACGLVALVLAGCATAQPRSADPTVADTCPDFSGRYRLGVFTEQCETVGKNGFTSFRLPVQRGTGGGGFAFMSPSSTLTIEQRDCSLLTFFYPRENARHGRWTVESPVDLGAGDEIEWSATSVFWSARFKPAGVRFGPSRNRMSLRLEKLADGALRYEVGFKESFKGLKGLSCVLPAAADEPLDP